MSAFYTDGEVDGFSDVTSEGSEVEVSSPDPGFNRHAAQPLSPEEYAMLQKEARSAQEEVEAKVESTAAKESREPLDE